MNKNNKLLIFDLDGTLINSDECILYSWLDVIKKYPPKIKVDEEMIKTFSGPSLKESIIKLYGNEDIQKYIDEYNKVTKKYYDTNIYLFENEVEVLKALKEKGFKIALNTNKIRERTLYTLNLFNILDLFDEIVCGDDVKETKPNSEGVDKIVNKLNISKENTYFIGDTKYDYLTSLNSNVHSITLTVLERKEVLDLKETIFINSFAELYEYLIKLN